MKHFYTLTNKIDPSKGFKLLYTTEKIEDDPNKAGNLSPIKFYQDTNDFSNFDGKSPVAEFELSLNDYTIKYIGQNDLVVLARPLYQFILEQAQALDVLRTIINK